MTQNFPKPIFDYFNQFLREELSPAFILLDQDGIVTDFGGGIQTYGISGLEKGRDIVEVLLFMEGILPFERKSLVLSFVKLGSGKSIDVHIMKISKGFGMILLDAGKRESEHIAFHQKANELSLMKEKHSRLAADLNEIDLKDLQDALNVAILELTNDGDFLIIGERPLWINEFCPETIRECELLDPETMFSFLGHFIEEAKAFWKSHTSRSYKSGIWIEEDRLGDEYMFEATAVCTSGRNLLLIARDQCTLQEKKNLIQKGRELALDYHKLERLEHQVAAARDELEARVQERTRELEEANQKLAAELEERVKIEAEKAEIQRMFLKSQQLESIGTLAGGIAHDFNNILSAVIGFTELSLLKVKDEIPLQYNLKQVLSAANRAKELVRQILMFSRQAKPELKPIKLKSIIDEALQLLRASFPSTIEISADLQSELYVMADPTQMHQVIMNLCTNAGHAMKDTCGEMIIKTRDIAFDDDVLKSQKELSPGRYVMLIITDNGRGIEPEIIEKIFDPFFSTKNKSDGTGMGLSMVHGIIKTCKGSIQVDSIKGQGSIFKVFLPAFDQSEKPIPFVEPSIVGGTERILFVDDELSQAEIAVEILEYLGYQAVSTTDSVDALEKFKQQPDKFDLVITDLTMPKMTGKDLTQALIKIRPDIPVILSSGYTESISQEKAKQMGFREYLMKPIVIKDLARSIRRVLDKE